MNSPNIMAALTLPIIRAVKSCLHDAWTSRGLAGLETMDRVPLLEIQATLQGFGLEEQLGKAIARKLAENSGTTDPRSSSAEAGEARIEDARKAAGGPRKPPRTRSWRCATPIDEG